MGLEIFKKDNEFRQLTSIENCKKKIEEIVKKQQDIDLEFNVLESKFILINKNNVMKFLTEELNFMVYKNGQADVYNYQYKEHKYKIVVEFNDFNEESHIYFYMNQKRYQYDISFLYSLSVSSKYSS